jgi:hypothetical protein
MVIKMTNTPDARHPGAHPMPLYAVTVNQGIASGDLSKMKELEAAATRHLVEYGNVAEALGYLKAAIAKLEGAA